MPQLYASARESINAYRSSIAVLANTVLRSMFSFGFLFGPLVGSVLIGIYGFNGLFTGTVIMFILVLGLSFLIMLHVGQWMYLLNMPLYVTKYLGEPEIQ